MTDTLSEGYLIKIATLLLKPGIYPADDYEILL